MAATAPVTRNGDPLADLYYQPGTNSQVNMTSKGASTTTDSPNYSYVPDTQRYGAQTDKDLLTLKSTLDQQAADAAWRRIQPSMSALLGQTGGGATGPTVSYGGPDLQAAQDAAFARAKDRAGAIARSATDAVHEDAASRGVLDAGFTAGAVAKRAIAPSMNVLGDLNARQMAEAYNAASEGAKTAYQGAIEQRGQDQQAKVSSMNALFSALKGFV